MIAMTATAMTTMTAMTAMTPPSSSPSVAAPRRRFTLSSLATLSAVLLSACTVGPSFKRPTAQLPAHWPATVLQSPASTTPGEPLPTAPPGESLPAMSALEAGSGAHPGAGSQAVAGPAAGPLTSWWRQFGDATLDTLIERAVRANLDLRAAVLRTSEALAQRDIDAAGQWPTLSANASYDRERISETTPEGSLLGGASRLAAIPGIGRVNIPNPFNQAQLGAGASWEPDLFGRLRRTVEAANASAQVSLEDQRSVRVAMLAQVAQSYIELRGAQARRAVALADLATIDDLLQLTQQRHAAGLNTELDVRNARAQASQTRASLPGFELQITQAIHRLGVLLGEDPEALRSELDRPGAIPPVPPQVPLGLPAELARRRPDIREAEASLHAATAQVGVAVADLYPQLTLSANGGFQSESIGSLLRWSSLFGSVGPALDIPIFDRGRRRTVRLYNLKAQEAALAYQSAVLNALHEVEDAAAAYRADQQQRQWLTDTVAQNRIALDLARQRYQSGLYDFTNVLEVQRTLQQSEQSLLESTTAVSSDLVTLYRALGGGWSAPMTASAAAAPAALAPTTQR
jgi:outer membrane protein, multidrug efflux system